MHLSNATNIVLYILSMCNPWGRTHDLSIALMSKSQEICHLKKTVQHDGNSYYFTIWQTCEFLHSFLHFMIWLLPMMFNLALFHCCHFMKSLRTGKVLHYNQQIKFCAYTCMNSQETGWKELRFINIQQTTHKEGGVDVNSPNNRKQVTLTSWESDRWAKPKIKGLQWNDSHTTQEDKLSGHSLALYRSSFLAKQGRDQKNSVWKAKADRRHKMK